MPYQRPTLSELNKQATQDIVTETSMGGSLLGNAVLRVLASTVAYVVHGLYGFLDWISRESVPWSATGERLEAWGRSRGVLRILATPAAGEITITGQTGAVVPVGTLVRSSGRQDYTTQATLTLTGGTGTVAVRAVADGTGGNLEAGARLVLASPVDGVSSSVVTTAGISGGTDNEIDEALYVRVLRAYATPPQGGSENDYITWALEVPAVTRAWAKGSGTGNGVVNLYVMTDGDGGDGYPSGTGGAATADQLDGVKATGDLLAVADYVYPRKPVAGLCRVYAPTPQAINVTLVGISPDSPDMRARIEEAITVAFREVGTALGGTIYQSQITDRIRAMVPSLERYTMTAPVTPVVTSVGSIPVLGTVTYS